MSLIVDPMVALLSLQQAINNGDPTVNPHDIGKDYVLIYDEPDGKKRFGYAKVVSGDVQTLAMFVLTEPIDGVTCFNVGYAVKESHRGRGLAIEAVNKGIKELKKGLGRNSLRSFYVEAVIDETNAHSIKVAEKLFSSPGVGVKDHYTGTPALHFKRLISIR